MNRHSHSLHANAEFVERGKVEQLDVTLRSKRLGSQPLRVSVQPGKVVWAGGTHSITVERLQWRRSAPSAMPPYPAPPRRGRGLQGRGRVRLRALLLGWLPFPNRWSALSLARSRKAKANDIALPASISRNTTLSDLPGGKLNIEG